MNTVNFNDLKIGERFTFSFDVQDGFNNFEYVKLDNESSITTKSPTGSCVGRKEYISDYHVNKCVRISDLEKKVKKKSILKVWNSDLSKFEETETSNTEPFVFFGYTIVITGEDSVCICKDEEVKDLVKKLCKMNSLKIMTKLLDMLN